MRTFILYAAIASVIVGLLLSTWLSGNAVKKGFFIVPVADLLGSCAKSSDSYYNLPLCGAQNKDLACPRLHQGLFNEMVDILEEKNNQYRIQFNSAYYVTKTDPTTPQTTYWALKDTILPLETFKKNGGSLETIPSPLDFRSPSRAESTITLTQPYTDPLTKLTFSAGTRFVPVANKQSNDFYTVYTYNKKQEKTVSLHIPTFLAIATSSHTTREQKIKNFLQLLRSWAHTQPGFIPYGWGCTSYTKTSTDQFREQHGTHKKRTISWYVLDDYTDYPMTGFDCSGIILRAAQIAGIPYFCKNTFTIEQCLKPLTKKDHVIEGDLILIPGHVMVVADLRKNSIIEARHYAHGYGKVHEISLEKVFKDIKTFNDLTDAYYAHKTVYRIDKDGIVRDTIPGLKIFRIMSVWE